MDARKINAKEGRLNCEVRGEAEDESGVLVSKRVHVTHKLGAEDSDAVRKTVERVHGVYAQSCPVYIWNAGMSERVAHHPIRLDRV